MHRSDDIYFMRNSSAYTRGNCVYVSVCTSSLLVERHCGALPSSRRRAAYYTEPGSRFLAPEDPIGDRDGSKTRRATWFPRFRDFGTTHIYTYILFLFFLRRLEHKIIKHFYAFVVIRFLGRYRRYNDRLVAIVRERLIPIIVSRG